MSNPNQLSRERLESRCAELGMNQAAIAAALDLSREAVSKWFRGKTFPRPAELLKLGKLLKLPYGELVMTEPLEVNEPVVAFRKRRGCKTTQDHYRRAKEMGHLLAPLVPYLEFDAFVGPPSLKHPSTEYRYLQHLVADLRRQLGISGTEAIAIKSLMGFFSDYQAVTVPVLWGKQIQHENALHIFLPESETTWIYLNLDVEIHDFRFWIAHELGHVLTLQWLKEQRIAEAEDFADAFAGAFLFPETMAQPAYEAYQKVHGTNLKIRLLTEWAEALKISPYSVYCEMRNYAVAYAVPFTAIDPALIHAASHAINQRYGLVSEKLFGSGRPDAEQFIRVAKEKFDTRFFDAFRRYVHNTQPSLSTIAAVLHINPMDAHAFADAMSN